MSENGSGGFENPPSDGGWGEDLDQDVEEQDEWEIPDLQDPPLMKKTSTGSCVSVDDGVKVFNAKKILNFMPKKINEVRDLLFIDNDDTLISILRHFNWDKNRVEARWFDDQDKLEKVIGIKFDQDLTKDDPLILASTAENNGGCCNTCYCEFEEDDPEYEMDQLVCGHQYHAVCWQDYLKNEVRDGPSCVFSKCQQHNCNVVIPYSFYKKHLPDEECKQDGINYWQKYQQWHCK